MKNKSSVLESILAGGDIRDILLKESNESLTIQPGDVIKVGAEKAVVKDILFQDVFLGNDHQMATADVEFKDDAGNYRHWQSWSDGGTLITADDATYKFVKESKTLTEGAKPCGGDKKHYFLFYVDNYGSYPQNTKESIAQFGKDHLAALKDLDLKTIEDSHMYWGTEGSGFNGFYNGDTYVLFDDVDNLPADFKLDALKYCNVSPKVNESTEDVYHCDACGEEMPFDATNWFTSSIGFCDKCWDRLHKNVDKRTLANLYDASSSGDDRAALKVIHLAQESKFCN